MRASWPGFERFFCAYTEERQIFGDHTIKGPNGTQVSAVWPPADPTSAAAGEVVVAVSDGTKVHVSAGQKVGQERANGLKSLSWPTQHSVVTLSTDSGISLWAVS